MVCICAGVRVSAYIILWCVCAGVRVSACIILWCVCRQKVTDAENGITNGIEIFQTRSGATWLMTSNNDKVVRIMDTANFARVRWVPQTKLTPSHPAVKNVH
jgi:hypothetical protein